MPRYLPIALSLDGRRCVVIGGGAVAARRAETLIDSGGHVVVVAPDVCAEIEAWAEHGRLLHLCAAYEAALLDGAFLVIAATDRREVNAQVAQDARERGILCNDAESPERGDFVIPSILRRGDLLFAVTTGGASPRLASRIRGELERLYGSEYGDYVALLGEMRQRVMQDIADTEQRRAILTALAHDETLLALIREGRAEDARARAFSCISSSSD